MLFNSTQFALFLPVVVGLYFIIPARRRWILLLFASYYFYASWRVAYLLLILISTGVDYWAGIRMSTRDSRKGRRPFLLVSLTTNLGLLFTFKYLGFFTRSAQALFDSVNILVDLPIFDLLLPVGISFYTFQTLSYSIDVYYGKREAERHLGIFALYVAYFPQLVAGPIERSTTLLPSLHTPGIWSWDRTYSGLRLMLWGFFKKLVIADNAAGIVNVAYADPEAFGGFHLAVATYFFAFQIYCDFSGYSDIAIGASRIFGYDLMTNFRRPYFAKSVGEFWKRWHISLSTWFRDYLYIPLGGNRATRNRWFANLMIVFVVSGLWHGANWTFAVWGALHGTYLIGTIVIAPLTESFRSSLQTALGSRLGTMVMDWLAVLLTFHLVLIAWVFFRAESVTDAVFILSSIVSDLGTFSLAPLGKPFTLLVTLTAIGFMQMIHVWQKDVELDEKLVSLPVVFRWSFYFALIFGIAIFGNFQSNEFIYFQF